MQVHVKMPHIKIDIEGDIPPSLIKVLKKEFGKKIKFTYYDEEFVNVRDTDWFKKMEKSRTPGMALRIYRENAGLTQTELGNKLGGLTRQKISDMENSRRIISVETAEELAKILGVSVDRFL